MIKALVLVGRGYTADQLGHHERAVDYQREGLEIALAHSMPRGLANSMEGLAGALAIAPDSSLHASAARLLGAADGLRRRSGGAMPPAERFDVDRAERRTRRSMGDPGVRGGIRDRCQQRGRRPARSGVCAALTRHVARGQRHVSATVQHGSAGSRLLVR